MKLKDIVSQFENKYPTLWAIDGDNVGLICGDPNRVVEKILVCLDPSLSVIAEAAAGGYQLIVSHHPPAKKLFQKIIAGNPTSGRLFEAIKNNVAIYSAHTNLDFAPDGVTAILAEILGVRFEKFIEDRCNETLFKLIVYIPEDHFEKMRNILLETGAGSIGNYSHCSFYSKGEGTFFPKSGAEPFVGQVGKLEKVAECRLETIVPQHLLSKALETVHRYHPYEEPAYDVVSLGNNNIGGGFGIIGEFAQPIKVSELIHLCKSKLPTEAIRFCNDPNRTIRRIAVLGGAGDSLVEKVIQESPDAFLCGELSHHSALALDDAQIAVILPGHFATEWIVLPKLRDIITEIYTNNKLMPTIKISKSEQPLFNYLNF
jgi:dinuclear metal center YbgI/SA1388 family protein